MSAATAAPVPVLTTDAATDTATDAVNNTTTDIGGFPELGFINRVTGIPLVGRTMDSVAGAYTAYGRESASTFVRSAVGLVDSTASSLATAALPFIERHQDKVRGLDAYACSKFDDVEGRIAAMQRQKDDVVNTVVNTVSYPKASAASLGARANESVCPWPIPASRLC